MALELTTSYLKDSIELFRHYQRIGELAIEQCPDAALARVLDPESNSIATLVKHLAGNMRSRWTDFLTSDGEKANRNRDDEFEAPPESRAQLLELWNGGWRCLFDALGALGESDLARTITIRSEPHSVIQAINRQVAHYSYHVGQIVYLAKHFTGKSWQSLSVPRRQSAAFNADVAAGKKSQR